MLQLAWNILDSYQRRRHWKKTRVGAYENEHGMVNQARSCYPVEGFTPWRETPEGRTRDEGVEARAERGPSRA